jgi:Mrp family chromosome partitioning ATPase
VGRLWRRRRWFAAIFAALIVPLISVIVLWRSLYYASGTVIIGNLEPADSSLAAAIEKLGDPADLASQLLIAQSPRMMRLALERPGVFQAITEECNEAAGIIYMPFSPDCRKLKLGSRELLEYVMSRYSVQAEGRSRIISISYWSPLPEASFILANALLITYLEDQRGDNARARETAVSRLLKEKNADEKTQPKQVFYSDLYKKTTDLETERRDHPSARLVSLAELPVKPAWPKRLRLLAAGFAVTTFLAGFLTVLNPRGRRIRLPSDIRELTSGPVFSSLPSPRVRKGSQLLENRNQLSLLEAIRSDWESQLLARAARTLYAELALDTNQQRGRCILIASAKQGEGKTLATVAIARAAAESGRRVLVIDCDLRHSADQPPGAGSGLADILRGEMEPQDTVIQANVEGLEVIQTNAVDNEPAILFIDGQLPKLMKWARQYDFILLHGPSGFVPELRMLASHADGLLWCVRWGRTFLSVSGDLSILHRQRVNLLGVAVTMVDEKEMRQEGF